MSELCGFCDSTQTLVQVDCRKWSKSIAFWVLGRLSLQNPPRNDVCVLYVQLAWLPVLLCISVLQVCFQPYTSVKHLGFPPPLFSVCLSAAWNQIKQRMNQTYIISLQFGPIRFILEMSMYIRIYFCSFSFFPFINMIKAVLFPFIKTSAKHTVWNFFFFFTFYFVNPIIKYFYLQVLSQTHTLHVVFFKFQHWSVFHFLTSTFHMTDISFKKILYISAQEIIRWRWSTDNAIQPLAANLKWLPSAG